MKVETATHEIILSNVGTTGEFKIRNSAKAFNILSSGLYSNKIRAIIRELSCNAVDSHVGAGKPDVPFEVHLPTILEPWFAVRDFGLGLDNDQVVNVYTTYFESTKTDSNDFIGALGLGSKSPFSYTDNFTVTAIKNGIQRIYSAFINEAGVPSIAEMGEQLTDEGNGVEVKFSVTDRNDYYSFRNEANQVFRWFKFQPKITGNSLIVEPMRYIEKNIVPGVHSSDYQSMALMGNIAYPIHNIPQADKHFGDLAELLNCNLVMEFQIGELDFAASREQLSFIPLTIASIKKKLVLLNDNLAKHLSVKANAIAHPWNRAYFLHEQSKTALYKSAVVKYVVDTKFELYDATQYNGLKIFSVELKNLADRKLTISMIRCHSGRSDRMSSRRTFENRNGVSAYIDAFSIPVDKEVVIVLNDLKTGCQARARYHYIRQPGRQLVVCLSHPDPDLGVRQVEYDKLLAELHNPPTVVKASTLDKEARKKVATQGITYIRCKTNCHAGNSDSYTWEPYRDEIDEDETYYYVGLSGYKSMDEEGKEFDFFDIKAWMDSCGVKEISNIKVFGVRKNRIAELSKLDNWVRVEEKLREETVKITDQHIASLVVSEILDSYHNKVYTNGTVARKVDPKSDYNLYFQKYGKIPRVNGNVSQLVALCTRYGKAVEVEKVKKDIQSTRIALYRKYPLLKHCEPANDNDVAEYIKMIDNKDKQ